MNLPQQLRSARALLRAFAWAVFNEEEGTLLNAAYGRRPDRHPAYFEEKGAVLRQSPLAWFMALDPTNQTRFLAWLAMAYGDDAERHVAGGQTELACWTPCPCCEDFICNLHGAHAHDCPCPPVEDWHAIGADPYIAIPRGLAPPGGE